MNVSEHAGLDRYLNMDNATRIRLTSAIAEVFVFAAVNDGACVDDAITEAIVVSKLNSNGVYDENRSEIIHDTLQKRHYIHNDPVFKNRRPSVNSDLNEEDLIYRFLGWFLLPGYSETSIALARDNYDRKNQYLFIMDVASIFRCTVAVDKMISEYGLQSLSL